MNAAISYSEKSMLSPCFALISCNTRGRRVTMPDPRGKKSLFTQHSATLTWQTVSYFTVSSICTSC